MPFIKECLASLFDLSGHSLDLSIMLVDCISEDGTTDIMRNFVQSLPIATLYRIEGTANAAVARNVILDHAPPGAVLLLDGDVVLDFEFALTAIAVIETDEADAVTGSLTYRYHGKDKAPIQGSEVIYGTEKSIYVRHCGGILLISPRIRDAGLRFDEALRRNEDRDYSLRLSSQFRLLQIPNSMGVHLTQGYHHASRLGSYYSEAYSRPTGQLLRKYLLRPQFLFHIVRAEKGIFLGLVLQTGLLVGLLTGPDIMLGLFLIIGLIDFLRFFKQRRINEYIPIRIAAPWYVLWGLLGPAEKPPIYTITRNNL